MSCLLNNAIKIAINKLYSQDVKLKDEQFRAVESVLRGKDVLGAIPFNIHTPLWTRSIKFKPLRKKDQSADTNIPPEIKKFLPYPSEKTQRSKDADAHNPSETAFSNPLRNSRP